MLLAFALALALVPKLHTIDETETLVKAALAAELRACRSAAPPPSIRRCA